MLAASGVDSIWHSAVSSSPTLPQTSKIDLIDTYRSNAPAVLKFVSGIAFSAPNVGAYTQLWAGTTASPDEINGKVSLAF